MVKDRLLMRAVETLADARLLVRQGYRALADLKRAVGAETEPLLKRAIQMDRCYEQRIEKLLDDAAKERTCTSPSYCDFSSDCGGCSYYRG